MVDPNFRTPYFDEWNLGVERQLPGNLALDANYVASNGRHEDWGPTMNTPQPGTRRRSSPAALPVHAAAVVRSERRQQPLQRLAGHVSTNVKSMVLASWLLIRCRIRTPMAATWVEAATHRIHTIALATTVLQTSTRSMRFRRHSRRGHHLPNLPISWSPMWLGDGRAAASCNSVPDGYTP